MQAAVAIGIDVGGTGIKGSAVDPRTGERLSSRHRTETPAGGRPDAIAAEVADMVRSIRAELSDSGVDRTAATLPIGVTLPGVVRDGVMLTAANVDEQWIGLDAAALFTAAVDAPCLVVNDADAAGIAEAAYGALQGFRGVAMVLTFGTGIGSACLHDGVLVPNFELGHLHLDGHPDIEQHVSPKTIEAEGLTIDQWAARAARYVQHLEHVLNPDRFVIGGSISKNSDEYLPFQGVRAPMIPAHFLNDAGIVGAAALAAGHPTAGR